MFKHEKQLFHPVTVEKPNPRYAALMQEQLGGANGELKAAITEGYPLSVSTCESAVVRRIKEFTRGESSGFF